MAEFFIMKKYRRKGIGQKAAFDIFSQFDVKWELSVSKDNKGGKVFWKKIVESYANNNYEVIENKNDLTYIFRATINAQTWDNLS